MVTTQQCREEYQKALRMGQKEKEELAAAGKGGNLPALDELVPDLDTHAAVDIGVMEIPIHRIAGVRTAGRVAAFTPSFLPLLDLNSEFAGKWIRLCAAHLGDEGIREPITCFEYMGDFYVQEGNKRVSVLRYFGAATVPAVIRRILPEKSDDPKVQAYYEFLEFFRYTQLYCVQFRRPLAYNRLLALLGREPDEKWTEEERRIFRGRYSYFREALAAVNTEKQDISAEEALLLWLELYPYADLSRMSANELKQSVAALWQDIVSVTGDEVKVETKVDETRPGFFNRLSSPTPGHLNVAFIHQLTVSVSGWALGHDNGAAYLAEKMCEQVTVRSYFDANTPEAVEETIAQAVADGAQVVFTTSPGMSRPTLRAALQYPKVFFFNCSIDQSYSSIRAYYGRVYEAKFITGAIAGAMAQNDRIGYIASYPTFGVPASINAFALGAQMTNPRAQIELRWSCVAGNPQADFFADGIRVVSNRDVPVQSRTYLDFCNYGTYQMDDAGVLIPLGSPVWRWGRFYETIVSAILSGSLKREKDGSNYWLGMDGGYIDIELSDRLPAGVRELAELLRSSLAAGRLDPFGRRIRSQDGTVRNPGDRRFTMDEIVHMDWLCDNVAGAIPAYEDLLPMSRNMVRELGIYRDAIPAQKEAKEDEDTLCV